MAPKPNKEQLYEELLAANKKWMQARTRREGDGLMRTAMEAYWAWADAALPESDSEPPPS